MTIKTNREPESLLLDKRALQRAVDELNQRLGFVRDTTATAEESQELMLAQGIRPEDCAFSREIIKMRSGDEE